MSQNDLQTHEFENDIQRFMQIRDQVHEEIKKISTHAATLDETNKRLVAHFDVFKALSATAEENMKVVIKSSAREMAQVAAKEFSQLIDDVLKHKLAALNQSIYSAKQVLETTMGQKYRKLVFFAFMGSLLCGVSGLGTGYFYAKQKTYELPKDFFTMYVRGLRVEEKAKEPAWKKLKTKKRK